MEKDNKECVLVRLSDYEALEKENEELKEELKKQNLILEIHYGWDDKEKIPLVQDGEIVIKGKLLKTFKRVRAYCRKIATNKERDIESYYRNRSMNNIKGLQEEVKSLTKEVKTLQEKNKFALYALKRIKEAKHGFKWYQKSKALDYIFKECEEGTENLNR